MFLGKSNEVDKILCFSDLFLLPSETESFALESDLNQRLYFVPAFTGLGAPYWDADARGAIYGLTRNSGPEEICRAF